MEQHRGFEPLHSAWKADVLAVKHQCCRSPTGQQLAPPYINIQTGRIVPALHLVIGCRLNNPRYPEETGPDDRTRTCGLVIPNHAF